MSYTRWLHNVSGSEIVYRGTPIPAGSYQKIEGANLNWYQTSDAVLADIAADNVRLSADGVTDYSLKAADNIAFLLGAEPGPVQMAGVREPVGMRARLVGIVNNTVAAGQTENLDWQMPQLDYLGANKDSYFDGIEYWTNGEAGDTGQFQVVDRDGLVYPAGTVLEEFGKDFNMIPGARQSIILYRAKIIPGMYIRFRYTSVGNTDVKIVVNLYRHLDGNS